MKGASPLPRYNAIEVINYFIKTEHERELARYVRMYIVLVKAEFEFVCLSS